MWWHVPVPRSPSLDECPWGWLSPWSSDNLSHSAQFPSLCSNESCVTGRQHSPSTALLLQTPAHQQGCWWYWLVTKISDTSTSPVSSAQCCGCTQEFAKVRSKTQLAWTWLWCRVCMVPALPVQHPATFTQGLIVGKLTLGRAEVKWAPVFSCPFYLERDHSINWAVTTFWKFNPKTESSFVFSLQSQNSPEQGGSLRAINKGQINPFLLCYS